METLTLSQLIFGPNPVDDHVQEGIRCAPVGMQDALVNRERCPHYLNATGNYVSWNLLQLIHVLRDTVVREALSHYAEVDVMGRKWKIREITSTEIVTDTARFRLHLSGNGTHAYYAGDDGTVWSLESLGPWVVKRWCCELAQAVYDELRPAWPELLVVGVMGYLTPARVDENRVLAQRLVRKL